MSLDIWLTKEEKSITEKNITNNLVPMWGVAGVYEALYHSQGKKAEEILPLLENGLNKMVSEPDKFKKLNSLNSWGTYKQAVPWLEELILEFKRHPDAIIGISY